jgi:hypothetical protein
MIRQGRDESEAEPEKEGKAEGRKNTACQDVEKIIENAVFLAKSVFASGLTHASS